MTTAAALAMALACSGQAGVVAPSHPRAVAAEAPCEPQGGLTLRAAIKIPLPRFSWPVMRRVEPRRPIYVPVVPVIPVVPVAIDPTPPPSPVTVVIPLPPTNGDRRTPVTRTRASDERNERLEARVRALENELAALRSAAAPVSALPEPQLRAPNSAPPFPPPIVSEPR